MNTLLKALDACGCDIEEIMDRFLNDEEFYESCYYQALADESFEQLGNALEKKDTQCAFEHAHALKGVIANMGITPLYELIVEIVESLRAKDEKDLLPVYHKLIEKRAEFQQIV